MKVTAKHIEVAVANHYDWRRNIIVPNVSWGLDLHECDILIMSQSGYLTEVEIKISFSDLKKDFEKKHNHDGNGKIKYLYYAMPDNLTKRDDVLSLIPEHAGILQCSASQVKAGTYICHQVKPALAKSNARPLADREQFELARLGTMRIWNLKRKLLSKENGK